jgi:cell wall-associated NlpC family hydrolase
MGLTGSGRKAAVLCTAVVLFGSLTLPAQAAPLPPAAVPAVSVPASPEIPSPEEIAAAKASESATADQVARIDRILADAAAAQEASFAAAMQANNAYGDALVTLEIRRDAATLASAKAASAGAEQAKTRKQVGQLAGDLYRNGGLNPTLTTFVSGKGEVLQQAATLEAITASRSRAFEAAENAASAAKSLTAAAEDANRAADDAARAAEDRKSEAERANAAQVKAVSEAKSQRTVLVDQLANLKNTTVALESARVDALDRQRAQERLAAVTAAAAEQATAQATSQAEAQAAAPQGRPAAQQAPAAPAPAAQAPAEPAPAAPAPPAPAAPAPEPAAPSQPGPVAPAPAVPAPEPAPVPAPSPGGSNQTAISVALGKVGSPYFYKYGGSGPLGFDCSGLVQNAFAAAGKYLPRTASQQYAQAPVHVPLSQAQPGDLLVWGSAPDFYHVAIYLGGGRVVQALNPEDGITVTDLAWMAGMQLHPTVARY